MKILILIVGVALAIGFEIGVHHGDHLPPHSKSPYVCGWADCRER